MAPPLQNFVDKAGPVISAAWLNEVDDLVTNIFQQADTNAQARAALCSDAPLEVANGGTGATTPAQALINLGALPQSVAAIGALLFPPTAAETVVPVVLNTAFEWGSMLRYGLVPNDITQATNNTTIAQALFNFNLPTGPQGRFYFPNLTGNDVYYFNGPILFRPGCHIDLNGCTLSFTKTSASSDSQGGFIFATRDFSLVDGNVTGNYGGVPVFFALLQFGARDAPVAGSPLPTIFDSLLSEQMGNIRVRDVYLNFNNPAGNVVNYFGGVNNVAFENVKIDGNSQCMNGIYGEYGWATNQVNRYQRQTSHMHNHKYKNMRIQNISTLNTGFAAMSFAGGYNISVENLHANSVEIVCAFGSGESLFFNPWVGVDDIGTIGPNGRTITLRNIVGRAVAGNGINFNGASNQSGYLNGHGPAIINEVDQLDLVLDGFNMDGGSGVGGNGIVSSAGITNIRNGTVTNFQKGILLQSACTLFNVEQVKLLNNSSIGLQIGQASAASEPFSPPRKSTGRVAGCFIAGSGTIAVPAVGLFAQNTASLRIDSNRFGYEIAHDSQTEASQTNAVSLDNSASGVVCSSNYVAVPALGALAYVQVGGTNSNGNTILTPQGVQTLSGFWDSNLQSTSNDRGDANVSVAPGVDFQVQIFNSPLSTARTVTLQTTGATNQTRWRVVRTSLATGASVLNVGPKSLAVGQWVDFQWSSSLIAYIETGSGSL